MAISDVLYVLKPFPFLQIGTENSFLETPVKLTQLTLAPRERQEFVLYSPQLPLLNLDSDVNFDPADPQITGQILKSVINESSVDQSNLDESFFSIGETTELHTIVPLIETGPTRKLALLEEPDDLGSLPTQLSQSLQFRQQAPSLLLDPTTQPQFVNLLPLPARIDATNGGKFDIEMRETVQWLGLVDELSNPLMTTVWGYGMPGQEVTYPGPTFLAQENVPIEVKWKNKLPKDGHLLPIDTSIHLADPMRKALDRGYIPTVTHLHGGHTESASDGLPEAWFVQGWSEVGPQFVKKTYFYENDQQAATLWYHDHALGITRLNVYAGLAGFYLLRDENELNLIEDNVLPSGAYEREIVVQDRMFTADGQLYYPSAPEEFYEPGELEDNRQIVEDVTGVTPPPVPEPTVLPEFFGDHILVNGTLWPELDVESRKYRLRLLNGSDSRFYVFEIKDEAESGLSDQSFPFLQIGTDNGFLEKPVELTQLTLAPGERADLVVNFDQLQWLDPDADGDFYLRNFGPDEPFGGGTPGVDYQPADPGTTGQIMKFDVSLPLSPTPPFTIDETTELNTIDPLTQTGPTRKLALFEGLDEFGRLQPLLGTAVETVDVDGNTVNGSLGWFEPITENPVLGNTEIWEFYNATEDAHPVHIHLVSFQILNRESFTATVTERPQPQHDGTLGVGAFLSDIQLGGDARDPAPNEAGWKDTVIALPGEVTRVAATFDKPGRYVWHCHILSHEDHEMMRPYEIVMTATPVDELTAGGLLTTGTEETNLVFPELAESLVLGQQGFILDDPANLDPTLTAMGIESSFLTPQEAKAISG